MQKTPVPMGEKTKIAGMKIVLKKIERQGRKFLRYITLKQAFFHIPG
jgi:hypothetical protein